MLIRLGIISSSPKDLLIWDSTLGTTACNVLSLPTKDSIGVVLNPPWANGWFTGNGINPGESRIELATLNIKASSVIITSGVSLTTGTYIVVVYEDGSRTNLRVGISTTATEEYVLDSTKKIQNFSVNVSGVAGSFMSYIKLKGVTM